MLMCRSGQSQDGTFIILRKGNGLTDLSFYDGGTHLCSVEGITWGRAENILKRRKEEIHEDIAKDIELYHETF